MVGGRNDGDQNKGWVSKTNKEIEYLPESVLAHLATLKSSAKQTGVVDHGHANAEGVAKMHGWHSGQLIDVLAAHPYTLRIVVADSVEETVLGRKQPRRHAGVQDESDERAEVG